MAWATKEAVIWAVGAGRGESATVNTFKRGRRAAEKTKRKKKIKRNLTTVKRALYFSSRSTGK